MNTNEAIHLASEIKNKFLKLHGAYVLKGKTQDGTEKIEFNWVPPTDKASFSVFMFEFLDDCDELIKHLLDLKKTEEEHATPLSIAAKAYKDLLDIDPQKARSIKTLKANKQTTEVTFDQQVMRYKEPIMDGWISAKDADKVTFDPWAGYTDPSSLVGKP